MGPTAMNQRMTPHFESFFGSSKRLFFRDCGGGGRDRDGVCRRIGSDGLDGIGSGELEKVVAVEAVVVRAVAAVVAAGAASFFQ